MATTTLLSWLRANDDVRICLSATQAGGFQGELKSLPSRSSRSSCRERCQRRLPHDLGLDQLPEDILQRIFRHLSGVQLCRLGQTCRYLYQLTSSDAVWRDCLRREMPTWQFVEAGCYPGHQQRTFRVKETYMAFSPCGPRLQAPRVTSPSSTMSRFSFAAAGRRLRIAICGPGLEIPKLDVVSNIMYTGPFRIKGMVSGHQGIGGGVELQHENGRCIELITLYQRPQHERNNPQQAGQARLTHSGLSPAARELLSTIDAFVFAVNASHMLKADASRDNLLFIHQTPAQLTAFEEYSAILGHSNAPVLVLSCQHPGTTTCATPSTGVVDTVEALRLTGESRPWRIEHLPICGARVALRRGFDWLVQAQPS